MTDFSLFCLRVQFNRFLSSVIYRSCLISEVTVTLIAGLRIFIVQEQPVGAKLTVGFAIY
jgi:hypothetical protein